MSKRSMILGAALAVLFCVPASAQGPAPEVDGLAPCYVSAGPAENQRQSVTVTARNFTQLSKVDILIDETLQQTADVAFNGTVSGSVKAPFVNSGQQLFTLRVAEEGNPQNTVTKTALVTAFRVDQSPRQAKTSRRVVFRGRGFMEPYKYVFAHYVFAGKVRSTVQIGYPQGPCGTFRERRKQFPIKRPNVGPWTIQFDQERTYDPNADTRVQMAVTVRRAPKASRGR